jgi:hypothetical protein
MIACVRITLTASAISWRESLQLFACMRTVSERRCLASLNNRETEALAKSS